MFKPQKENTINEGIQKVYRFNNGYGASVVRNNFSYGHNAGLWELAVLKFENNGSDDADLCYDTEITDDVVGYLTDNEVVVLLERIRGLKGAP